MKKTLATVASALTIAMALTVVPSSMNMGLFSADVVSAATGGTSAPTTPTKPATKPSTTTTTAGTSANITKILKLGSNGSQVKTLQTLLNNKGYNLKVDGFLGKLTQAAVKDFQAKNGLSADGVVGPKTLAVLAPAEVVAEKVTVKLGKAEYAAHGTKCFTVAVVAMAGDKIADVYLDDYQFMAAATSKAVPNSDKDFGTANYKDPKASVLASKRLNAEAYSKNMKEKGGATLTVDQNFAAVQEFAKGKTIAQLEEIRKANPTDPKVDAVSGATLTDTNGYIDAIIAAAKAADVNKAYEIDAKDASKVKVAKAEYAAHGTKCFTVASVALVGDKVVGAYLDDYQFMAAATSKAVPNSDKDFGTANYKDSKANVLASKRLNAEAYSKNMKEKGGATLTVDENFGAVEEFVVGKTIAQLEEVRKTNPTDPKVDAVSGATLTDTNGYLDAFIAAAKTANGTAVAEKATVKLGKAEYAAHGTKCFTVAVVAMAGDKIADVYLDDYQFMATATSKAVPNSDKDFGTANYKDPAANVLASKRLNAEAYSKNMKEKGGATLTVDQNFTAVQEFAKGKTIAQLEEIRKTNPTDPKVDAVSGATLTDTNGYLDAVIAAAKAANANTGFAIDSADVSKVKVAKAEYAAHGTKCFTVASVALVGNKVVGAYLDDYQFMATATTKAVPNSDKDFGTVNYKDPAANVLASKRLNAEAYSKNMKERGGATLTVDENFGAVEAFVTGKTIAQLEEARKANSTDPKVDAVSGATLTDTNGYLDAFIAAAKAVK
jgi:peptidoglycan hydrolase-like protein with peptidoglycan-binding domain